MGSIVAESVPLNVSIGDHGISVKAPVAGSILNAHSSGLCQRSPAYRYCWVYSFCVGVEPHAAGGRDVAGGDTTGGCAVADCSTPSPEQPVQTKMASSTSGRKISVLEWGREEALTRFALLNQVRDLAR